MVGFADFLPSVERVRASARHVYVGRKLGFLGGRDLLSAPGVDRRQLAAVLVACRGIVRTRKETAREIGPYRANRMFRGEPPPPAREESQNLEVLLGVQPERPCSDCAPLGNAPPTPGIRPCAECSGTGRVTREEPMIGAVGGLAGLAVAMAVEAIGSPCHMCHGRKVVPCSTCEGTGMSVPAIVGNVTDTPVAFANIYIPSLSVDLETRLEQAVQTSLPPPECLRIKPDHPEAELAGFAFEDRLERARGAIARAVGDGQILAGRLDVHAWPMLVLRAEDGPEAVVFVNSKGVLETLTAG